MIASYGDAIIDLFALPIGASIEDASAFEPHVGGSTCNVAVVAARAGARVRFIGAVGPDAWGERVRASLAREGIDGGSLVTIAGARTPVTFCASRADGTRFFLSYRNGGADSALSVDHLDAGALDGVRWLHLASSSLRAEPRATATRTVVLQANSQGISVSVDLNVRPGVWSSREAMLDAVRWLCARASIVKASEEDLALLGEAPTLDALSALAPGAIACVLTRAERGASARVAGEELDARAPSVAVIDSVGAGDAFVGALLAALDAACAQSYDPARDAARWPEWLSAACRAGALAVTAVGATAGVARERLVDNIQTQKDNER